MGISTGFYWIRIGLRDKTTWTGTKPRGFTKCLDIATSWMTGFALRIDFASWQPLYRSAATPSCSLWYSNPQSQRESEVMQLETSTTRPQCSVLGLVIICSDNNVGVRAVKLCGLDLPLNHTVKGNDAVSAQNWRTSHSHSLSLTLSLSLSLSLCLPFLCCLSSIYRFGVSSFVSVCASVTVRCQYNPL